MKKTAVCFLIAIVITISGPIAFGGVGGHRCLGAVAAQKNTFHESQASSQARLKQTAQKVQITKQIDTKKAAAQRQDYQKQVQTRLNKIKANETKLAQAKKEVDLNNQAIKRRLDEKTSAQIGQRQLLNIQQKLNQVKKDHQALQTNLNARPETWMPSGQEIQNLSNSGLQKMDRYLSWQQQSLEIMGKLSADVQGLLNSLPQQKG
jgi:hypothetical protein